jgi:uncharacterized protein with von Willebrand factor type A (vWA) domain
MLDVLYNEAQAIRHDRFDTNKYDDVREMADELRDLSNERYEDDHIWANLVKDTYLSLWKASPELLEENEMLQSHLLNRATMEKIIGTKQYNELRTWTLLDDWSAAMGTVSLALRLAEYFDENKDLKEQQENLAQQEQEMLDAMQQMASGSQSSDEEIEEFLDEMEKALDQYESDIEEHEQTITANQTALRSAAQEGMEKAQDEAEETQGMVEGFGTDPGQWTRLDPRMRMQLAARLRKNKTLLDIAKMIGRMKRLAVGQWSQRVVHGVDEIYDLTLGDDLTRVVPSELVYLADEELEDVFWSRYATHSLLQYKMRGAEKTAQGAIICMVDNSYSMHGQREVWAKAVALSLLEIAKREHRDFYGIHFGSASDMKEWHFPKGEVELSDVLDYAEWFFNSGTDFETPISRAVEVLEDQFSSDNSQKGDLIMISDGECSVSDEWMTRFFNSKEALSFRMYSVLINESSAMNYWQVLETLSDKTWTVQDIATGGEIRDIWSMI